jgi:tetratricopeptide (TPR) repeat protein
MLQHTAIDITSAGIRPAGRHGRQKRRGSCPLNGYVLLALVFVLPTAWALSETSPRNAAELIARAHGHDNMYTLGPEASQERAVQLYELALQADPNERERLHILFRMAQLYGSAYQVEKGEKPNFRKAIDLCQQIIDTYPPEEPLVVRAMIEIGDHYVSLWEFERAVEGFKKTLTYDTGRLETLAASLEERGQHQEAEALRRTVAEIKRYQEIAVDQVAYSAGLIDPLRAHGELRSIADRYAGTFIGDKASQLLQENMDKLSGLWMPDRSGEPASTQFHDGNSPFGVLTDAPRGIEPRSEKVEPEAAAPHLLLLEASAKPQPARHTAEARAPPRGRIVLCLAVAAGLVCLGLAGVALQTKGFHRKG